MSVQDDPNEYGTPPGVERLARRVETSVVRADASLRRRIDDFFLQEDERLDDHLRVVLDRLLANTIGAIEAEIRSLAAGGVTGADGTAGKPGTAAGRLARAGLLRDPALMNELMMRVRQHLLQERLPLRVGEPDQPSLLVRLAEVNDASVAEAASALLAAENRRRDAHQANGHAADLPADLYHRLVWWIAAVIREEADDRSAADHAIVEAAQRSLVAHDEGKRVEALAMRLAIAIDARPHEVAPILEETLGDRRLALFVAVLAVACRLDFEQARAIVLDRDDEPLLAVLRALALDREAIARIGLALVEAEPRRDVETLPDRVDAIGVADVDTARAVVAPLSLNADYRAAILALGRSAA